MLSNSHLRFKFVLDIPLLIKAPSPKNHSRHLFPSSLIWELETNDHHQGSIIINDCIITALSRCDAKSLNSCALNLALIGSKDSMIYGFNKGQPLFCWQCTVEVKEMHVCIKTVSYIFNTPIGSLKFNKCPRHLIDHLLYLNKCHPWIG